MREISDIEFQRMIEAGHETEQLEFRTSFSFTKGDYMTERLIRTALGMANLRDGGRIIIGVAEDGNGGYTWNGVGSTDLASFTYDKVKEQIDSFSAPVFKFDLGKATHGGHEYVVVSVSEFELSPIICKKNGTSKKTDGKDADFLRDGDVYVRSSAGNIGTKKVTEPEMRELLERSVDKNIARLKERGLLTSPATEPAGSAMNTLVEQQIAAFRNDSVA